MSDRQQQINKRNRQVGLGMVAIVGAMVGLAYASVPLYQLFCQVTGFGGTPQIAEEINVQRVDGKTLKVRFDSSVNATLDWHFKPNQREMVVTLGQDYLASYRAINQGGEPVVGTATFNVTPMKAAPYFSKIECFCFTEQTLSAGERADMPVSFYVDPEIMNDPNTRDVTTITLSYTFFKARTEAKVLQNSHDKKELFNEQRS